jgi:hypothetical protein
MAQGTPQEVMTPEMVKEVFQLNCRIVADPSAAHPFAYPSDANIKPSRTLTMAQQPRDCPKISPS